MEEIRPDIATRFVKGDPRRINKPVGARMKQITQFRKFLDGNAGSYNGEPIDRKTMLLIKQYEKAKEDKDTAAYNAVMAHSGYKPVEKLEVETKDTEEFSSEAEEKEFNVRMLAELIGITDGLVDKAETIIQETANANQ